jgi:tetratricopeptide (TPR) repeat protein
MSLEPLSEVESHELVVSLLGRTELPAALQDQISRAAEGNPLFLEELLGKLIDDGFLVSAGDGWSTVGDLRQLAIPPTIQALLAARLDGLSGEERRVIERAAVEGKVFHRGAVMDLTPEPMRGQVRERLASLMRMELVRPDQASFAGEEAYRFRHLLIRDAAYQALAKQTRSELHERFAAWLERAAADRLLEYEEIVAYHLEQAYRYRIELGTPDAHAQGLAQRAGTLLGDAGERADLRGDVAATVDLLGRAVDLLPEDLPRRRRLLFTLGNNCFEAGDGPRAERILADLVTEAERTGDEGVSALAAVALVELRASTRSTELSGAARELERLGAILARLGDEDGARLAEASVAFNMFAVGQAGEAIRRAQALLTGNDGDGRWQRQATIARGVSLVYGPTPIEEAIGVLQSQMTRSKGAWAFHANRGVAILRSLQGRFDEARELHAVARGVFEELGNRSELASLRAAEGGVERLAGNLAEAARLSREGYEAMAATGGRSFASTFAAELGEALIELGDDDGAWRYATIALDTSSTDDVVSQAGGRAVQARVLARRGEHDAAAVLAREAVAIMAATDYLVQHGLALVHLAHVLQEGGHGAEAIESAGTALDLFTRKGASFLVERTQRLIDDWAG